MIIEYLDIIQQDEEIVLKLLYNDEYIRIKYNTNSKNFYYCNELFDLIKIVPLSFLYKEASICTDCSLEYISKDAFNKYWNNYVYDRGKEKYPVYDLHFINQTHLIDFRKKLSFNYIQPFERIKEEFKPIPTEEHNHLYIYFC